MKTSTIKMIAAFAAVCLLSANIALAKPNGGSGGSNSGNHSAFNISLGGNNNQGQNGNHCNNNQRCYNNGNCNQYGNQNFGQALEPFHSSYVVQPGDSFYTVSLKEYGTSANSRYIARFNNMPENGALVLGQTLMLPSISANGALTASRAPVAGSPIQGTPFNNTASNFTPSNFTPSNFGPTTSNVANNVSSNFAVKTAPVVEAPRPTVTVGSTLLVDGQKFGDKPGAARLRVSGLSLPIEVLEWTTGSVKIHLPTVELTGATKADIEVVRADGSLASKTAVELGAATEVALTK